MLKNSYMEATSSLSSEGKELNNDRDLKELLNDELSTSVINEFWGSDLDSAKTLSSEVDSQGKIINRLSSRVMRGVELEEIEKQDYYKIKEMDLNGQPLFFISRLRIYYYEDFTIGNLKPLVSYIFTKDKKAYVKDSNSEWVLMGDASKGIRDMRSCEDTLTYVSNDLDRNSNFVFEPMIQDYLLLDSIALGKALLSFLGVHPRSVSHVSCGLRESKLRRLQILANQMRSNIL